MKALVFACKYPSIVPYFAKLWNKYYSDDIDVTVISSYNMDELILPKNFSSYKLSNYTKSWVNDISEFFNTFNEDFFFSCMEDHFLYNFVHTNVINCVNKLFQENENVYKFGCCIGEISNIPTWAYDQPVINFSQSKIDKRFIEPCPVRQSLMPSIWRTSYFKYLLEQSKDYTAWEFELRPRTNIPYRFEDDIIEKLSDKNFLFFQSPEPYPMIDLVRSGQDNFNEWKNFIRTQDDMDIFLAARKSVFNI